MIHLEVLTLKMHSNNLRYVILYYHRLLKIEFIVVLNSLSHIEVFNLAILGLLPISSLKMLWGIQ